jgi:hypothetical protein
MRMPRVSNQVLVAGGVRVNKGIKIGYTSCTCIRDAAKHQRKGRDVEGSKGWHVFHLAELAR